MTTEHQRLQYTSTVFLYNMYHNYWILHNTNHPWYTRKLKMSQTFFWDSCRTPILWLFRHLYRLDMLHKKIILLDQYPKLCIKCTCITTPLQVPNIWSITMNILNIYAQLTNFIFYNIWWVYKVMKSIQLGHSMARCHGVSNT